MPNSGLAEIYFIAAMMILITIICIVAVFFFFRTFARERAEKKDHAVKKSPEKETSETV